MINLTRTLTALSVSAALAACSLEPRYERPAAPVAAAFAQAPAQDAATPLTADIGWRDFFADARLQKLIEIALANNRDLRLAVLNIEAARAQYRIQRADLLPGIDADAAKTAQHLPDAFSAPGQPNTTHSYSAALGITAFELDLFGRVRSLSRGALQQYLSIEETRRSAQITLLAEVASAYLNQRTDQALLEMTAETLANQQSSYALTRRRFQAGVASALDLRQAQTALETARANLAKFRRLLEQDRNALRLLLGVAALPPGLPAPRSLDTPQLLTELPPGLPSEVLAQRPDVRAAEHRLIAANANIGAARAAFFPRITLTGSHGSLSRELDGLFDGGTRTWRFTPSIKLPLFAGGANRANLDLARTLKDINVARYEQAIQTAFREVADALVARDALDEQLSAQQALVEATQDSYRLANMRFNAGVDSYLAVLDAQRSLYAAQQSCLTTRLARLQNLVTLYKALGGGWHQRTVSASTAAP